MGCHMNKLNVFNQISIMNISCFGNIMGYEEEYISGLKNINPSEAILMDRLLNRKGSNVPVLDPKISLYNSAIYTKRQYGIGNNESNLDIFNDKIAALNNAKNKAVEAENFLEAEKLKQIVLKIDKLKSHIK